MGDLIVLPGSAENPSHVPAYALRHGRPDVGWVKPEKPRRQLRAPIAFRKEGTKK
jgi:hypothetical protein